MSLVTKTRTELVKSAQDLRDEATSYHQQAQKMQDRIDRKDSVLANKEKARGPLKLSYDTVLANERDNTYKLMSLAFIAGVVVAEIAEAVL